MRLRSVAGVWGGAGRGAIAAAALCVLTAAPAAPQTTTASYNPLPRFPTLHGDTIVFEADGDLWKVGREGGTAERLTTDPGFDLMPRFSPDGRWVAFTGEYDGNTDVYAIPAAGGPVTRLTFHSDVVRSAPLRWGPDNMVVTWTPDSKRVVFLSRRNTFNDWFGRLFTVPVEGGLAEQLPIPKGGMTSYGPSGRKIAYNRIFRNFRTWKHYTGGLAQDVWIYDFDTKKTERVTDWKGTDTDPMWYGDTLYFASDRGPSRRMNIWAYSLSSKTYRQVTGFTDYDVDWPSLGDSGIVFQCGGDLYVIDLPSETLHKLKVQVPTDGVRRRPRWEDASKSIRSFEIAPNGKRALFSARGDLFTVPAEHGNTRDLTQTTGANERYATWSPDGKWVAYMTDAGGDEQVAIRPSDGSGSGTVLTSTEGHYYYEPRWSPGSDKLAFSDNTHTLWYVDVGGKKLTQVGQERYSEIHDYHWSPDGRWLAYSINQDNRLPAIYLYSLTDGKATRVSDSMNADFDPVFGPDGKYLFFLSARHENPAFSESEQNIATLKMFGIYAATLQKGTPSPFAPRSDEGNPEAEKKPEESAGTPSKPEAKKETQQGAKAAASPPIQVDLDGLAGRAVPLPIPAANYDGLSVAKGRVYYMTRPVFDIDGPLPGEAPELHAFDMEKRKATKLVTGLGAYVLSADGSKILYAQGGGESPKFFILDAKSGGGEAGQALDLSHMQVQIDPEAEWSEMFGQAWRVERDFFYNTEMNGVDWPAIRTKYEKLLPRLGSRQDLNYVIGEMIGELGNSHTYVGGGDSPFDEKRVPTGLLGVDFALDSASSRFYLKKIYPGDNSRPGFRSPLTEPGVDARAGQYILAVDGHDLKAPTNPYSLFVNKLDQTVTLTLANDASGKGSHEVTVRPIRSELELRNHDWIEGNRRKVAEASDGKIGYLYLSDMSAEGMNQFIRQFYPQLDKQGLIVDVRWNGGGFIDQILLERLRRVLVGMETNRERAPFPTPGEVLHGYMVCLMNHYSASDGDIFPYYFRKYGLGPLIGERSWGGVRGIRGGWTLLDGGYITVPEFSLYGLDSQWVIENHGVEPDSVVDDLPGDVMAGHDAQLQAGIDYILTKLKQSPKRLPPPPKLLPPYPQKGQVRDTTGS